MARALRLECLEDRRLLAADIQWLPSGKILIEGTAEADEVSVAADDSGHVVVEAFTDDVRVTKRFEASGVASILFRGRDGDDLFKNSTGIPAVAYGNGGNDVLAGGDGDDRLHGGPGNDSLLGGVGNDSLHGDHGDDMLDGGAGDDELFGWYGDDTLDGGEGNDYVSGYLGDDRLDGGAGDDELHGHEGDDELVGGAGNDRLLGFRGDDRVSGGEGNDYLSGWSGDDQLDGGAGNDHLRGHAGDDLLHGGAGDDLLDGGSGDDTMHGDEGDFDRLFGGLGDDRLIDLDGALGMHGGSGDDVLDLVLREGWRKSGTKRFDGKLSGGYGEDEVRIELKEQGFFLNITGDERDTPESSAEGGKDVLTLTGKKWLPGSVFVKFEVLDDQTIA